MTDRYGIVTADIFDHEPDPGAVAVFTFLAVHAGRDGCCWPSLSTIAAKVKRSVPWVIEKLDWLRSHDLVTEPETRPARAAGARSNVYQIRRPALKKSRPNPQPAAHKQVGEQVDEQRLPPYPPMGGERGGSSPSVPRERRERRQRTPALDTDAAVDRAVEHAEASISRAGGAVGAAGSAGCALTVVGSNAISGALTAPATPQETRIAEWAISYSYSETRMVDWADDIKDQMVREIDLLDTAIARQEQELRGADPATIGTVLKPLIAGKDCSDVSWETLAYSLSLEIATLHTSLPAGLLMRAAREVMKKKTGYHKRRIEAGDLIAAVKPAIEVEEERLRRLKDIRAKVAHLKDRRR